MGRPGIHFYIDGELCENMAEEGRKRGWSYSSINKAVYRGGTIQGHQLSLTPPPAPDPLPPNPTDIVISRKSNAGPLLKRGYITHGIK